MNIEQIAQEVADELAWDLDQVEKTDMSDFLRRCLSKMAEQDIPEPLGTANDLIDDYVLSRTGINPNDKLYTEAQLLAAQQRTAEACASLLDGFSAHPLDTIEGVLGEHADAIRNGEWRDYL